MQNKRNKKYRFCIVTYEASPNPITQNLKFFLLQNTLCDLLYIFHPMAETKDGVQKASGYYLFIDNKPNKEKKTHIWKGAWPLLYTKDVLYTLLWCFKFGRMDIYFAAGNLNPVAGIILKKFGLVKKVIYQSMDYYPVRFKNKFFNWLYFQLDIFCVRFADETWNASPFIAKAREEKMGMKQQSYLRQYTVPGGVWFYKTKRLPFYKINKKKIVYRGWLLKHMGVDLVISALPLIVKEDPEVRFDIIGGGEEEKSLKQLAGQLGVSKNVFFHGWIADRQKMEKLLSDAALGMATFNTDILDEKIKNADPGKIKDYMLFGIPVVTTEALSYSRKLEERKCGIVIPYQPQDLSRAVLKLLSDQKILRQYRENTLEFIKVFDWDNIFRENINRILT